MVMAYLEISRLNSHKVIANTILFYLELKLNKSCGLSTSDRFISGIFNQAKYCNGST